MNTYNASKIAKKMGIPFVYYFIDVLHALIPEKAFQELGKKFTQKAIENSDLVITINKKLSEFAVTINGILKRMILFYFSWVGFMNLQE